MLASFSMAAKFGFSRWGASALGAGVAKLLKVGSLHAGPSRA